VGPRRCKSSRRVAMWCMVGVSIKAFIRTKAANKGVLTEEGLVVIEWVSIACIDEEDQVRILKENEFPRALTYIVD